MTPFQAFIIQTFTMLVDAARRVIASRLFTVTLLISALIAGVFACVGINDRGISILWWTVPLPINTRIFTPAAFYKLVFTSVAVPWWLSFCAYVLALISCSGIFPDLLNQGSIDLYLSKPVSRLRLFLTTYIGGLLFVAAQALLFSGVAFLVIGIRGGMWEPGVLSAVPMVVLVFSFLFCICTLVGVLTRSSLAALFVTLLAWGAVFMVNSTEQILLSFKVYNEVRLEESRAYIANVEQKIAEQAALPEGQRANMSAFADQLERTAKPKAAELADNVSQLQRWHGILAGAAAVLPKTGETVSLLSRNLLSPADMEAFREERADRREARRSSRGDRGNNRNSWDPEMEDPKVTERIDRTMRSRSASYIIGTSLGFEAVILGIAAWVFCRRDY
jgi:ABC-type transport system involved in multi-copper enzyme maturation permease subunit